MKMFLFVVSIFLSAFLIFQIQPMIGKLILPWFGGTPALWSTVMLFFQVLLTGGYAYAYWLIERAGTKRQVRWHASLILSAFLLLLLLSFLWESPVTPDASWKPKNISTPIPDIFRLLTVSVGLPYFILAANGPLMQAWYSRLFPRHSYARLYALSNFGSLLGLLTYPVLIEPTLSLRWQGWIWTLGFLFFGLVAIRIAFRSKLVSDRVQPEVDAAITKVTPSLALRVLWIALSATASLFLLSVTNQITQEVAVIPFLWVLPLALYLLSFILTFSGARSYPRKLFIALFILSAVFTLFVMLNATSLSIRWQMLAYCLLLFSACMICHGELYLLRPPAHSLTTFYLMVSMGGAFGGMFVSLVAPVLFNGYWEFFIGLATTIAIVLTILRSERNGHRREGAGTQFPTASAALSSRARFIVTTFCLVTLMLAGISRFFSGALYSERNFYGVIRVNELFPGGSTHKAYEMSHGITIHGIQFVEPELHNLPTTYYVPESGAGLAILNHPKYGQKMRVGLLGLGIGTLVTYAQPGDEYRLYEINPSVVELAEGKGGYFSFLGDSEAQITTVLGDARISLERELAEGNPQNFDVLVLDTFSSDSIPVHLVTKEAFGLYLAHLAPDGIIAAHITNLHLDLQPVLWRLAQNYGLRIVRINNKGDSIGGFASHWILMAKDPALLEQHAIQAHAMDLHNYSTSLKLWTDTYSNLFQILK
ncbi:MAG TPA: hypothetical protein VJ830_09075 [Anaerolineales bacterium]|nr:hypothetical protein [Anaerolineales bacterium]